MGRGPANTRWSDAGYVTVFENPEADNALVREVALARPARAAQPNRWQALRSLPVSTRTRR